MTAETLVRPGSPIRRRFGRKKFDKQPTQSAEVLIATSGDRITAAVIRRAVELSEGGPVAVVTLARIYGSAYGLPSPGLMPSKKELAERRELVTRAISRLERAGTEASGQIAATRRPVKTIVSVAKARGVRHVIVVSPETAKWRQFIEGDLVRDICRRLPDDVSVETARP